MGWMIRRPPFFNCLNIDSADWDDEDDGKYINTD